MSKIIKKTCKKSEKRHKKYFQDTFMSSSKFKNQSSLDNNTVLVREFDESKSYRLSQRLELYDLRATSKKYWTEKERQKNTNRNCYCGSSLTSKEFDSVDIVKNKKGKIRYSGLASCGSYWRCPTCALKISNYRQKEIYGIANNFLKLENANAAFITLTTRHNKKESLKSLLDFMTNEYRKLQRHTFFTKMPIYGQVKTLEITHGSSGWHPHFHILLFFKDSSSEQVDYYANQILDKWCNTKGNQERKTLRKSQNYQFVYNMDGVSDYVTKWDLSKEMTNSQIKTAKKKSLTPFGILKCIKDQDYSIHSEKKLNSLYYEYIEATFRKTHLFVSSSLKKLLNLVEKLDEEIVQQTDEIDEILLHIDKGLWNTIVQNNIEGFVLNSYEESGLIGVFKFLSQFEHLKIDYSFNNIPYLSLSSYRGYTPLDNDFILEKLISNTTPKMEPSEVFF